MLLGWVSQLTFMNGNWVGATSACSPATAFFDVGVTWQMRRPGGWCDTSRRPQACSLLRLCFGRIHLAQHGHALLLDERQVGRDVALRHRVVEGIVGLAEDVRGPVVAVDAVHAALLGARDLLGRQLGVDRDVLGHLAVELSLNPRDLLALLVGGNVVDRVFDVPVDAAARAPPSRCHRPSSDSRFVCVRLFFSSEA